MAIRPAEEITKDGWVTAQVTVRLVGATNLPSHDLASKTKTKSSPLINPYKTDGPIEPKDKLFTGQKELLEKVKNAVEASYPLLIYGQAQIGKTSLISEGLKNAKLAFALIHVDLRGLNLPELAVGKQAFKMIGQKLQNYSGVKPSGDITDYKYFHDYLRVHKQIS